jgi:hypothetical protein
MRTSCIFIPNKHHASYFQSKAIPRGGFFCCFILFLQINPFASSGKKPIFNLVTVNPMKKTLAIFLTAVFFGSFSFSCKKKDKAPVETEIPAPVTPAPTPTTTPPPPDPYTYNSDLQSSKDINFAATTLTDIEMICAFIGEGYPMPFFYEPATGSASVSVSRDTIINYMLISYNNTLCKDGKVRDGIIALNYAVNGPQAKYYRQYGYSGKLQLINYKVDGWKVILANTSTISNKLGSSNFNPATTNLSWDLAGEFILVRQNDTIRWNGTITKLLTNTSDPTVFLGLNKPINWNLAKVQYFGTASGTCKNLAYTFQLDANKPPLRDFVCSVPGTQQGSQIRPFTAGEALFTISNYHPRKINYGPPQVCDNKGTVSFKGEVYNIDLD